MLSQYNAFQLIYSLHQKACSLISIQYREIFSLLQTAEFASEGLLATNRFGL